MNYLQNLLQDIISYQRVIEGVTDKASSLSNTSGDNRLKTHMAHINERYQNLCTLAKVSSCAKTLLHQNIFCNNLVVVHEYLRLKNTAIEQ